MARAARPLPRLPRCDLGAVSDRRGGDRCVFGAIVAVRWPDATEIVLGLILVAFLVPLTLIDLDVRRLPNALVYPCGALGLVVGTALDPGGEVERLIAGAIAFAVFFVARSRIRPGWAWAT